MGFEDYLKGIHKSKGGIIRTFLKVDGDIITDITFSGDFFLYPEAAIDTIVEGLKGVKASEDAVLSAIEQVYRVEGIQSPGTSPSDFTRSIMLALGGR